RDRPWWLFGERETVYRRPLGVVGAIGTWNYPILLNAVPIAQALVAGNGVLWKPSELSPAGAPAMHELFLTAGFPPDLFLRPPATGVRTEPLALLGQATQAERLVSDAARRGARVLGSDVLPTAHDEPPRFRPTVLIGATPEMAVCREASFAPIVSVIPFDD